jgi:hypothetical protein
MTKPIARYPIYRKRVFDADIIELCVRWYISYRLSYRDLVEMMAERGIAVVSSANTQRRDGWCQEILMVETTQHGVRAHGNIPAQAMSGSAIEVMMRCRRRIRDTGIQGHMGTRPIVMGNPRFQNRP